MKQVIFLGFFCQIYKKSPMARIYVGDVMIDEIEIPDCCPKVHMRDGQLTHQTNNDVNKDVLLLKTNLFLSQHELNARLYYHQHVLDKPQWQKQIDVNRDSFSDICRTLDPDSMTKEKIIHPKIFVFIIDDETLRASQGMLRVEIKNSDSDYMNGFMTRSTLLYLSHFYIMPYALFRNPIEITQRYVDSFSRKANSDTLQNIFYKSYIRKKVEWPLNLSNFFNFIKLEQKTAAGNNVFGVDGTLQISMKKKHRIWWPEKMDIPKGFFWANWLFVKDFLVGLSDKYKQDENQRDSD